MLAPSTGDNVSVAARARHGGMRRLQRREVVGAALFLLPTGVIFVAFIAYPIVGSFALTFFRWDGLSHRQFIGLDNYRTLVSDPLLGTVLVNTLAFVIGDVALKMLLALFLAVLVNRYLSRLIRTLFRSVVFFPVIVSGVAIGIIWQWLMNTNLGLINFYLGALGLPIVAGWTPARTRCRLSLWSTYGATLGSHSSSSPLGYRESHPSSTKRPLLTAPATGSASARLRCRSY